MRRFRRLKLFLLGLLGLIGVLLIWLATSTWLAKARFNGKIAALRAAGQPVSLIDLAPQPIPADQNAATYIEKARPGIEAIEREVFAVLEQETAEHETQFFNGLGGPLLVSVRGSLKRHADILPLIAQAAECPAYQPPIDYRSGARQFVESQVPHLRLIRNACRLLHYNTACSLAEGHVDKAFHDCLVMLRLQRLQATQPMLINYLVGVAVSDVSAGTANLLVRSLELSDTQRNQLDSEIELVDAKRDWDHAWRSERAAGLDLMHEISPGWYPLLDRDSVDYLALFDSIMSQAPLPFSDKRAEEKIGAQLARSGILVRNVGVAHKPARRSMARATASLNALRVLNALGRLHPVDETVPDVASLRLPTSATIDPFNGESLKIKRLPEGWLVYSVGPDLQDNGGELDQAASPSAYDIGLGPVSEAK